MLTTKAQNGMAVGWLLGIFWFIILATIYQYGMNIPVMCWECYLDWNDFWDRFWLTLTPVLLTAIPFLGAYYFLYYRWANE